MDQIQHRAQTKTLDWGQWDERDVTLTYCPMRGWIISTTGRIDYEDVFGADEAGARAAYEAKTA